MIPYSLHVAFLIVISLLFYTLMLKKETYHKLNRIVLLGCLVLSFALPFVPVPQRFSLLNESVVEQPLLEDNSNVQTISPNVSETTRPVVQQAVASQIVQSSTLNDSFTKQNMLKWGFWIYWCGVVIFGVNLLIQLISVLYKVSKSEVIKDGKYRIVELDDDKAPCSFGNYIFINPGKYDWDTYNQILIHEKVHVQQYHTLDLIIAEVMVVFQWFNPLAWFYRKEIENNLEFLTDHTVIDRYQVKQDDYQLNLLRVSVPNYAMTITTNYNQSLLKQRIMMMNSRRSNIHIVWKYFVMAPLFVGMICLLNKPVAISAALTQQQQPVTVKKVNKVRPTNNKLTNTKKTKPTIIDRVLPDSKLSTTNSAKKISNNGTLTSVLLLNTANIKAEAKNFTESVALLNKTGSTGNADFNITWYENFTADEIIKLQHSGVSASYVQGIGSSGFRHFTADDIIALQHGGVSASYLQGIGSSGYKNLTANDIIALQKAGVSASYVQGIGSSGYKNLTANDIIKLQANGVSASYIQGLSH